MARIAIVAALAMAIPTVALRKHVAISALKPSGLADIPQELAQLFSLVNTSSSTRFETSLIQLQKKVARLNQSNPEDKQMISRQVKAMFPGTPENLERIKAWRKEAGLELEGMDQVASQGMMPDEQMIQSLLQSEGKYPLRQAIKPYFKSLSNEVMQPSKPDFNFLSQSVADKTPTFNPMMLLNPNLACFFQSMYFEPCMVFNVCLGAGVGLSLVPPLFAKTVTDIPMVLVGMEVSGLMLRNVIEMCSVANFLVGPRMPPLKGMIDSVKTR